MGSEPGSSPRLSHTQILHPSQLEATQTACMFSFSASGKSSTSDSKHGRTYAGDLSFELRGGGLDANLLGRAPPASLAKGDLSGMVADDVVARAGVPSLDPGCESGTTSSFSSEMMLAARWDWDRADLRGAGPGSALGSRVRRRVRVPSLISK